MSKSRRWEQGDDETFSDVVTTTMAFRLLRDHGYDVSSGRLFHLSSSSLCWKLEFLSTRIFFTEMLAVYHDEDCCFHQFGGHLEDVRSALELFRASQLKIYDHESYLEKQTSNSRIFLDRNISEHSTQADRFSKNLIKEVPNYQYHVHKYYVFI